MSASELAHRNELLHIRQIIPLNYPQGLYYVIQNKQVLDAYNKSKVKNMKNNIEIKEDSGSEFTHVPIQNKSFADNNLFDIFLCLKTVWMIIRITRFNCLFFV